MNHSQKHCRLLLLHQVHQHSWLQPTAVLLVHILTHKPPVETELTIADGTRVAHILQEPSQLTAQK